jgi:hypothetical protein
MKKTLFSILAILLTMGFSHAQSPQFASYDGGKMTDGTITYTVSVENSTEPSAAMLNGSTLTLAFNGDKSKLQAFIMGGMFAGDMILDAAGKKGLALLNIMGTKKAIRMSSTDITSAQSATSEISKAKIQELSGSMKIAGYKCKKLLIADPDKPGDKLIVYVTDAIQPKSGGLLDNMYKEFKGFPLGMEIDSKEGKLKIMASEVSTKRPSASDFKLAIPSDYEETTMEELGQEMGGMMGG